MSVSIFCYCFHYFMQESSLNCPYAAMFVWIISTVNAPEQFSVHNFFLCFLNVTLDHLVSLDKIYVLYSYLRILINVYFSLFGAFYFCFSHHILLFDSIVLKCFVIFLCTAFDRKMRLLFIFIWFCFLSPKEGYEFDKQTNWII